MCDILSPFPYEIKPTEMRADLDAIATASKALAKDADALSTMFNCIDLTSLNVTDSAERIKMFVEKVNDFEHIYKGYKNVGGICVYPVFAPVLTSTLAVEGVQKAVVAACFPSSQTFCDVKCSEIEKAVDFGATEVDVVISVGEFLDGNYDFILQELSELRESAGKARLKVILETGQLNTPELIWDASILAMNSGADMIKTSTGKNGTGATPEAAYVMCKAIAAYQKEFNRKVGFKPAGGVQTVDDACLYYNIVSTILGEEWLNNKLFRIGASRLANNLLSALVELKTGEPEKIAYF